MIKKGITMRKHFSTLVIAIFLAIVVVPAIVHADASFTSTRNSRNTSTAQGISQSVANADASTGYTQRVDSQGAAMVLKKPTSVAVVAGQDVVAVTGAARVYSINVAAPASAAGDYIEIYDALSATGTPKLEVSLGTAKGTVQLKLEGMNFATGVFVNQSANNALVSVEYQQ